MFGFGKKQVIEQKERGLSDYAQRKLSEKLVMRLFDLGFIGKPDYYSNGDMNTTSLSWNIYKPISPKYRLYLHGIVEDWKDEKDFKYRFIMATYEDGDWTIPLSDYIFINKNDLDSDLFNSIKHSLIEKITIHTGQINNIKDMINSIPNDITQKESTK